MNAVQVFEGDGIEPASLRAVAEQVLSSMGRDDRDHLRSYPKDRLINLHDSFGRAIRNALDLHGEAGAPLRKVAGEVGREASADEASMMIIETIWEILHEPVREREADHAT